ncbi:unnamed protein product [Sympodiomycopsis kandeliae]
MENIQDGLSQLIRTAALGEEVDVVLDLDTDAEGIIREEGPYIARDDGVESEWSQSAEESIERRYAQTWLTRVVALDTSKVPDSEQADQLLILQDQAASVLAALCGNSASTIQTSRFVFRSKHSRKDVTVRIQDSPVTADALGNRTWGAAPLLARHLVSHVLRQESQLGNVLELGAGTGLVGLAVAAALCHRRADEQGEKEESCSVELTDYHPHVLKTLQDNVALNHLPSSGPINCQVAQLDWQAVHREESRDASKTEEKEYNSTAQTLPSVNGIANDLHSHWPSIAPTSEFEIIIAADCIYDPHHPFWIRSVAQRHLSRSIPSSRLLLMSPLRSTHQAEIAAIYDAFPPSPLPSLQIVREVEEVGYDNFGPQNFSFAAGQGDKGLRNVYRLFEIRWVQSG